MGAACSRGSALPPPPGTFAAEALTPLGATDDVPQTANMAVASPDADAKPVELDDPHGVARGVDPTRARRLSLLAAGEAISGAGHLPENNETKRRTRSFNLGSHLPENNETKRRTRSFNLGSHANMETDGGAEEEAPEELQHFAAYLSCVGHEPRYKKTNQDNGCFHVQFGEDKQSSLYAVFDGHGPEGHRVSAAMRHMLPDVLAAQCSRRDADPAKAITAAFRLADNHLTSSKLDMEFSGCAAAVVLLRGSLLTCGWAGDSRVVLGREVDGRIQTLALTQDHRPTVPKEKERILESNGRICRLLDDRGEEVGPQRVWLKYAWIPGLSMSRALGDHMARRVGVTPEPEVCSHRVQREDRFIVVASDGLWEFVSNEEAVSLVAKCESPEQACNSLVDTARERWASEEQGVIDDITVIVVAFAHPTEDEEEA